MNALYTKTAKKALLSLDADTQARIKAGIAKIPLGDIRELKGKDGIYRLRIGKYRIVYKYKDKDEVIIADIGSRGDIYK